MRWDDEKKPLEDRDREYIILHLDAACQRMEPLAMHVSIFEEYDITRAQRNQMILESDYGLDEDLVSTLVLFG